MSQIVSIVCNDCVCLVNEATERPNYSVESSVEVSASLTISITIINCILHCSRATAKSGKSDIQILVEQSDSRRQVARHATDDVIISDVVYYTSKDRSLTVQFFTMYMNVLITDSS